MTMPMIIGFLRMLRKAFFSAPFPLFSGFSSVSTSTEKMLKSGTAPIIIIGAIPDEPYIFWMSAMPSTAALERQDAWTNAPMLAFSLMKSRAPSQVRQKKPAVAPAQ